MDWVMMEEKVNDNGGFSMIEVMIALAVFTISFLGFYNLQLNSVAGNARARALTSSAVWASDTLERLLGRDYDDLEDIFPTGVDGLDMTEPYTDGGIEYKPDGQIASEDGLYTMYWNVAEDVPIINVKQMRVIIVKQGGIGSENTTVFDYYKSNKF